ncbi:MAG: hypothetical protein K8953_05540, partial [Proteobacteria bacterium]|nr:hypothetical protein [Pseudomonadota bacterium]
FCAIVPANRFNEGCIDGGLGGGDRIAFCNMSANLFNQDCLDNELGNDGDRDTACLGNPAGSPEHSSCANRPEVIKTCQMNPFNTAHTGCENLATIVSIRDIHCGTSPNSDDDRCKVDYADWEASFGTDKAPMTTPNATRRNEFLNSGDGTLSNELEVAFGAELMTESITILNLNLSALEGGDATDGVAYFSIVDTTDNTKRYYYAGILSSTDLGAPNFQKIGTATWKGKFQVLIGADDELDVQDFELTVNFETQSIESSLVELELELEEESIAAPFRLFYLKGGYDTKGVISGTVHYAELEAAITASDRTTIKADTTPEGILTGLIGKQGAVGAFLSGTGDKDNITGGTSATAGFAGGFVANPFDGNVSYSDWATAGQAPADTANTANPQNQLLQTTRNDLNIGTITGTAVHFNLATATYEDVALGGLATNGFTTFASDANNHYAGITSTTNLGPALERTTGTGAWKGSFVAYEGGAATTTDFELMVE